MERHRGNGTEIHKERNRVRGDRGELKVIYAYYKSNQRRSTNQAASVLECRRTNPGTQVPILKWLVSQSTLDQFLINSSLSAIVWKWCLRVLFWPLQRERKSKEMDERRSSQHEAQLPFTRSDQKLMHFLFLVLFTAISIITAVSPVWPHYQIYIWTLFKR